MSMKEILTHVGEAIFVFVLFAAALLLKCVFDPL